jgi:hypothetical protein
MSDLARTQRRARTLSCPRCGTPMEDIVTIAPSFGAPGADRVSMPKVRVRHERAGAAERCLAAGVLNV